MCPDPVCAGRRRLFPPGAGPARGPHLLRIFVFLSVEHGACHSDLPDRLSVSPIFPKKRQSEVLAGLYLKTV